MYLKAGLFLVIGVVSGGLILLEDPSWRVAGLLVLVVWAFARAYYFAFYVIEHYVDPGYRFAGLGSFVGYLLRRGRGGGGAGAVGRREHSDAPGKPGG